MEDEAGDEVYSDQILPLKSAGQNFNWNIFGKICTRTVL